jgi:hypothetical protein
VAQQLNAGVAVLKLKRQKGSLFKRANGVQQQICQQPKKNEVCDFFMILWGSQWLEAKFVSRVASWAARLPDAFNLTD